MRLTYYEQERLRRAQKYPRIGLRLSGYLPAASPVLESFGVEGWSLVGLVKDSGGYIAVFKHREEGTKSKCMTLTS